MVKSIASIACLVVALPIVLRGIQQTAESQPAALFAQVGLTPEQRDAIDRGRAVAKVLPWGKASEVYVFGAVHIDGSPATYLKAARNVSRLAATPAYLAVGELPASPTTADLSRLSLDPDDIKALKECREGACDVQLPTASIQAFHDSVNWERPDAAAQVNGLARGMVLDLVREYRRGARRWAHIATEQPGASPISSGDGRRSAALPTTCRSPGRTC